MGMFDDVRNIPEGLRKAIVGGHEIRAQSLDLDLKDCTVHLIALILAGGGEVEVPLDTFRSITSPGTKWAFTWQEDVEDHSMVYRVHVQRKGTDGTQEK